MFNFVLTTFQIEMTTWDLGIQFENNIFRGPHPKSQGLERSTCLAG